MDTKAIAAAITFFSILAVETFMVLLCDSIQKLDVYCRGPKAKRAIQRLLCMTSGWIDLIGTGPSVDGPEWELS